MSAAVSAAAVSRLSDTNVTYIGDLAGRYTLSSREESTDGRVKVFACRARSISPQRAFLFAPVPGGVGERLALRFDELGILRANISRALDDGFVAEIDPNWVDIATLASRIDYLKQKRFKALADLRTHKRWVPRQSKSMLVLSGGRKLECFVIDVSASGVAVSADIVVEAGTPVAVGAILGRVVRSLELGFAVQFVQPQEPGKVEALLTTLDGERGAGVADALALAEAAAAKARERAAAKA
ncbi:MAG: PilZ domain-containing protein [Devosia sp.]